MTRRPQRLTRRPLRSTFRASLEELEIRRTLSGGTFSITVSPSEVSETYPTTVTFTVTRMGGSMGDMNSPLPLPISNDGNSTPGAAALFKLAAVGSATFSATGSTSPGTQIGTLTIPAGSSTAQLAATITGSQAGNKQDIVIFDVGNGPTTLGYTPVISMATVTLDHGTVNSVCAGCEQTAAGVLPEGEAAQPDGDDDATVDDTESDFGLATGDYFQDHPLVTYSSLGQDRGLDFQYSAIQASPLAADQSIVQATLQAFAGPGGTTIRSVAYQLLINGSPESSSGTYSGSSLIGGAGLAAGATFTVALPTAASRPTGIYNATFAVTETFSDSSSQVESLPGTIDVVNRSSADPYGAGWSIADLEAISTNAPTAPAPAASALLTGGSQGTMEFKSADGINYTGPPSDTSTLVRNPGGTWTRTLADGTIYQFDANGRLLTMADRNGNTTTYAYVATGAAVGALSTVTDPVGQVTTLAYNGSGKLSTVTDPAGRVTTFTVDTNGNLLQVVDPDAAAQQFTYSTPSNHRITGEISPDNKTATVTYDSYGRVSSEALFSNPGATSIPTTTITPGEEVGLPGPVLGGPVATATDPDGNTTTLSFDSMFHPLTSSDATTGSQQDTYARNVRGWATSETDPDGRLTTFAFDNLGNVTGETRVDGTGAGQTTVMTITYGVDSQPTQVVDNRGLTTTYALDAHGNVLSRTDPDSLSETWTYNSRGQVLTDTDRNGHTSDYAYDSLGRLVSTAEPSTAAAREVAVGGVASSSPSTSTAANAFDQSLATEWSVPQSSGTLTYQFAGGGAYVVTQYAITSGIDIPSHAGAAPRIWTFQGSNDGSTWTTLDTHYGQADTNSLDTQYYPVLSPGSYKYYQLAISANNDGGTLTELQELQLLVPATPQATDVATGGTASSSNSSATITNYAFDHSDANPGEWYVSSNSGYLEYQFAGGASYAVTQYAITSGYDTYYNSGRAPRVWTFQGSNTGAAGSWTTLDSEYNQADPLSLDTRYYNVATPGSYKYYQLAISANNDSGPNTELQELQLLVPRSPLSDVALGGTAASSPTTSTAAYAFDQSLAPASEWVVPATSGTLTYHFGGGASYAVTQYAITSGNDTNANPGRAPFSWTFQGSNDGSTWTTLDTQTGQADTASLDTRYYPVIAPGSYKYYQLAISANNGATSTELQELQLLVAATPPASDLAVGGGASSTPGGSAANYAFDQSDAAASKWTNPVPMPAMGSTPAFNPTLTYTFAGGAAYTATGYAITSGNDTAIYTGRAPSSWMFRGSNDGVNWTTLDTQTGQSDALSLDTKYYKVATPGTYRFYQLFITAIVSATTNNNPGGSPLVQLQELQILGQPGRSAFAYDAAGDLTSAVDEVGDATTYTYDPSGRLTSTQDPAQAAAGQSVAYAYDADDNLTTMTDALGHRTTYMYDARDRLVSMTDPANQGTTHATTYTYNGMNLVSETDPNGNTISFTYDGLNRLLSTTDAAGETTTWTYDAAGLLTQVTDPKGNATTYAYDGLGRLLTVTAPGMAPNLSGTMVAVQLTYGYNPDDQVTSVTDSLGDTTTSAYDNLGRLVSVTDALHHATTYGYDAAGNVTSVTDPNGHTTTSIYDARDRLVAQVAPADGGTTAYTYDDAGRLTSVTDPDGNLTSDLYDAEGRITSELDPKLAATTDSYDLSDNLKTVVDRDGRTTSYSYDADDREAGEQWIPAGGGAATYTMTMSYDPGGRLTTIADNSSQYAYGYDHADRLITVNDAGTASLPQVTMTYAYDLAGNRTSMADSLGGVVSYTYDARDELVTITQSGTAGVSPERADMAYDAAGRMTTLTRYSDLAGSTTVAVSKYAFDAANRLTTITHQSGSGSPLSSFAYTLDPAGRLTSEARTLAGAASDTLTYSYTNDDQLTSVAHSNGTATETFGFDANGNRNTSGYATGSSNQTTSDGTFNYAYDAEGNLTSKTAIAGGNITTYTWDTRNRLTSVVQVVGGTTTTTNYTYDALNRLIKVAATKAGVTTTRATLYDGETPLLDFDGSGAVTARYLSVPGAVDELLARQTTGGTVAWYLDDREGSVRDIISNTGVTIDHLDYGAFGNLTAQSTPANGDRFQYAGMEADANTGLDYDRARWYDPNGGKFIGQDPIGFNGGDANIYRFNHNSPVNAADASGLISFYFEGTGQAAGNQTIVQTLYNYSLDSTNVLYLNPVYNAPSSCSKVLIDDAVARAQKALKANNNEKIYIYGWSRGGVQAIQLAQNLGALGISVQVAVHGLSHRA